MSEAVVQNVIQNSIEEVFLLKSIDLYFWIGKKKTKQQPKQMYPVHRERQASNLFRKKDHKLIVF